MELGEQVFAERYEGGGASRREVETAQQFLPTRLDGLTQCVDRLIAGAFLRKILNGAFEPFSVGTEMLAKILQEGELYLRARPRISGKQGLGQSNTGCLAAARGRGAGAQEVGAGGWCWSHWHSLGHSEGT